VPPCAVFSRFNEGYVYYTAPEIRDPLFGSDPPAQVFVRYRWKLPD
jgi:hypothetical protein